MEKIRQVNYYRIGSFVIAGFVLLVVSIIIFGSGIFKRTIYFETYFNESVQGLTIGSPVKYLGMEIGRVNDITTVDHVYDTGRIAKNGNNSHDRYIYVKMALSPKFFHANSSEGIDREIKKDVAAGLRVKLALQGLTGNAYLELDFLNPKNLPKPLQITWKPEYHYIPSTTSTLTFFSDNVQYLLAEIKKIDIRKFFRRMEDFIVSANKVAEHANRLLIYASPQVIGTANNLRNISAKLDNLAERARAFPSSVIFGKAPPKLNLKRL